MDQAEQQNRAGSKYQKDPQIARHMANIMKLMGKAILERMRVRTNSNSQSSGDELPKQQLQNLTVSKVRGLLDTEIMAQMAKCNLKQASMKKIRGLMDGEILQIMRNVGVDKRSVGTTKTALIP